MKKLLGFTLAIALFASFASLQAQTILRPAVAFVKTPRDTLFIKQPDSAVQAYYLPTILNDSLGQKEYDSIRQLAVIGMTPAGDRLVIGCTMGYLDRSNTTHTRFQGLISLPWPITSDNITDSIKGLKMMQSTLVYGPTPSTFRPIGILSKDGKQWWATLTSETNGNESLTFYHGNTSGFGSIDSTTWDVQIVDGFHMSNIALDTKNNTMLAVSCNGVTSPDQETDMHPVFYEWTLGQDVNSTDFQGSLQVPPFANPTSKNIDSLFGLLVIPNNDGSTASIGMTPTADNSINLYSVNYTFTSFDLSNLAGQIPRSAIPADEDFFAGRDCNGYQEDPSGAEFGQPGNGGDMFVNSIGGDSILFVTHESPNDCPLRNVKSGIWMYDMSPGGSGSAQMLYDDSNAQELQPVWIVMPYTIPAPINYPGIAWEKTYSGYFGTVDTGTTASLTFTVINDSLVNDTIYSANVTGLNASEMTLGTLTYPIILQPTDTQAFTVTFKPVTPGISKKATLNIYYEGVTHQDTLFQSMSGVAVIPANGVKEDAALAATMSIQPNPFSSSAFIQLTAPDAGALGIQVRDALGRMVYTSDLRETGAGEMQSFEFDAKSLGLPDGVYYVTAFLGERQASRAVVFVH